MKPKIVQVPCIKRPIQRCPGFKKKGLADHKLDLMGRCQFCCRYCSSNHGNYLRINRRRIAELTEKPLGERLLPVRHPVQALALGLVWGWLPCGLVYAMLVWAFAAGGWREGALFLLCFGLGTLPTLMAVGFASTALGNVVRRPGARRLVR